MSMITISIKISLPKEEVWKQIADLESHTAWMADAETITITSDKNQGVGTTFDCETKVGPFRLTDRMEITDWQENSIMGVAHSGVVTGEGHFTLESTGDSETLFSLVQKEKIEKEMEAIAHREYNKLILAKSQMLPRCMFLFLTLVTSNDINVF